MAQESVAQETVSKAEHGGHHGGGQLGPILCWAIVFADIGTSVYYTPGILYNTPHVGTLAGFFVFLTMSAFVLLSLKYTEVTHRFPQGGGVVTVSATALTSWAGALGGMFILVDYFLTAAISCLSGLLYLGVVIPLINNSFTALILTVVVLALLGILNWVGISESARVSFVGAVIAFASDIAVLITAFSHISFGQFLSLFGEMFKGHTLTPETLLIGFAGSFLAFSGLESISQLSPVMREPHRKIAGLAMLFVVLTIGITSPLLTMLSTLLQQGYAANPATSDQLISLLGGHWGGTWGHILQTEVAISASALLVFASNTAIIGSYHVFMALSNMGFLPAFILKRNKLRGTPHFSIMLATGIPIIILIVVNGQVNILGDMYAFGLLGAFSLTCFSLDIARYRDWKAAHRSTIQQSQNPATGKSGTIPATNGSLPESNSSPDNSAQLTLSQEQPELNGHTRTPEEATHKLLLENRHATADETRSLWFKINFFLGILTTIMVVIAWSTNLITKPLATGFGGGVTLLGLLIAYINYRYQEKQGLVYVPAPMTRINQRIQDSVMAVLTADNGTNNAIIEAAVHSANNRPLIFLYVGQPVPRTTAPRMMEIVDPYLEDQKAKEYFGKAEALALKAKIPNRYYFYLEQKPDIIAQAWHIIHPHDTVVAAKEDKQFTDINPDRVRYEITSDGRVAHLLKNWA